MTAPVDDPANYPERFDMYIISVDPEFIEDALVLPGNAVDPLPDGMAYVGQVDGATLYAGTGSLAKGRNPHPVKWLDDAPLAPFAYGAYYQVIYQGAVPSGGYMRACLPAGVVYTKSATTGAVKGNALYDEWNVRAYWYFEPPAEQQAAAA